MSTTNDDDTTRTDSSIESTRTDNDKNDTTRTTVATITKATKRKMRKKLTKTQEAVQWRRNKTLELFMTGASETEIAKILQVSQPTVSVDLKVIKEQSKVTIQNIIETEIPIAWAKARKALQYIQKEAIAIATDERTNTPQRLAALTLFKETQESEFELITNSEILNDAFRYVEAHSKTVDNIKEALEQRDKERGGGIRQQEDDTEEDDDLPEHTAENKEAA